MLQRPLLRARSTPSLYRRSSVPLSFTSNPRQCPISLYSSTAAANPSDSATIPPSKPPKRPAPSPLSSFSLAFGVVALSAVSYWIYTRYSSPESGMKEDNDPEEFFILPVPARVGGKVTMVDRKIRMLRKEEAEKKLKEQEETWEVNRPGNRVRRWDTVSVASNSPIEDAFVSTLISRPASVFPNPHPTTSAGDLCFWGIFDGHSGPHTSKLLSTRLVPFVAKELQEVFNGSPEYLDQFLRESGKAGSPSRMDIIWSLLKLGQTPTKIDISQLTEFDSSPSIVATALKNGFRKLDDEIRTKPLDYLKQYENRRAADLIGKEEELLAALQPAFSGACSLLAYLDSSKDLLHVAVSGDSRAIMGKWEPDSSDPRGRKGKWKLTVLSQDQTGRNEKEVQRMRSEHPSSEADTVVRRGRVLGSLEPTRALGDCRYKWPVGVQERLVKTFAPILPGSTRGVPASYRTPPYVTPVPEVVSVSVAAPPTPPEEEKERDSPFAFLSRKGPTLRDRSFVVLATDGLYDRLTNEEIVGLVGGWLDGVKGWQSTASLLSQVTSDSSNTITSHSPTGESRDPKKSRWIFQDDHLGTHLVRNALGAADKEVRALLSIPPPVSRRYRDDITVTVILIGNDVQESKSSGPSELEGVTKVARSSKL